jgi:hypothetical protein
MLLLDTKPSKHDGYESNLLKVEVSQMHIIFHPIEVLWPTTYASNVIDCGSEYNVHPLYYPQCMKLYRRNSTLNWNVVCTHNTIPNDIIVSFLLYSVAYNIL